MTTADQPHRLIDDGHYLPTIKRHSIEKIRLHNRFAGIFSEGMHKKWPQRAYIGLYAGAGAARVLDTAEVVETSALAVHRQGVPFTHHVYVEQEQQCVDALRARLAQTDAIESSHIIHGDVNSSAQLVLDALPPFSLSKGLLSFCFVDPFDLTLKFSTIQALSKLKMDMLVLLMLGVDGRRNFGKYLEDPESRRIGDFIASPNWRDEYLKLPGGRKPLKFLLDRFDQRMVEQGYLSAKQDLHRVKAHGKGVLLYLLAFYSRSAAGQKFWRESRKGLDGQLGLLL